MLALCAVLAEPDKRISRPERVSVDAKLLLALVAARAGRQRTWYARTHAGARRAALVPEAALGSARGLQDAARRVSAIVVRVGLAHDVLEIAKRGSVSVGLHDKTVFLSDAKHIFSPRRGEFVAAQAHSTKAMQHSSRPPADASESALLTRLAAAPGRTFQAHELASALKLPRAEINRLLYKELAPRQEVKSFRNHGKLVWQYTGSSTPGPQLRVKQRPPAAAALSLPSSAALELQEQTWEARYHGACAERDYWKSMYEKLLLQSMPPPDMQ